MEETIYVPWITIAKKISKLQQILNDKKITNSLLGIVTIIDAEKGLMRTTKDFEERYGNFEKRIESYYAYIKELENLMQDSN